MSGLHGVGITAPLGLTGQTHRNAQIATSASERGNSRSALERSDVGKGEHEGECNRKACKNRPAVYFNKATEKYYCKPCATRINELNRADCLRLYGEEDLCVVKYETP